MEDTHLNYFIFKPTNISAMIERIYVLIGITDWKIEFLNLIQKLLDSDLVIGT